MYASNRHCTRRFLCEDLIEFKDIVKTEQWAMMGDFNVMIDPSESSAGSYVVTLGIIEFRECLGAIEMEDLAMMGLTFTWN